MSALANKIIIWYRASARDLPWRQPGTTPWAVLVSEVMLQQTPVARVLPAWREWLDRWPTPAALAREPSGEAVRLWGRLGYPRRALRLHQCAVAIVTLHDGVVPSTLEDLQALPGIGTYTARAVATFAFGQRHPVVDTNVRRVVARAAAGLPDAGPATTAADLSAMEALLPEAPAEAAVASIGFMELGALLCTARTPSCSACPLRADCAWLAAGAPPGDGPSRRPQRYVGTDRYVRGLLLGLVRDAEDPVPRTTLDLVWPDAEQRSRALIGLLADGLLHEAAPDTFTLPR